MRELIQKVKHLTKEVQYDKTFPYSRTDKIGASVSGHFGYQNLRAFWPMSSLPETFAPQDISGQARHMSGAAIDLTSGLCNYKIPYLNFNGLSSYAMRDNETGLEITSDITIGFWVAIDTIPSPGVFYYLLSKESDYSVYIDSNGFVNFTVTNSAGPNEFTVTHDVAIVPNTWYNIVARLSVSNSLDILVNYSKVAAAAPADIRLSGNRLWMGTKDGSTGFLDGRMSWTFLAAAAAGDKQIRQHYDCAKSSFKVYE